MFIMFLTSWQSLVKAAMRKDKICVLLFVLGLMGNCGQSYIGSMVIHILGMCLCRTKGRAKVGNIHEEHH